MKRLLVLALLIGLLPPYLFADEFGDFRIPRNTSHSWILYLNGSYQPSRRESSPNYQYDKNYHGSLSTNAGWGLDSDELSRHLSISAQTQGQHYGTRSKQERNDQGYDYYSSNRNHQDQMSEQWTASGSCRRYPWTIPVGFQIGASLKGNYAQYWYDYTNISTSTYTEPDHSYRSITNYRRTTWSYAYNFSADAAFGYGRVRNATSIYRALLLEKRLLDAGTLTKPLSAETRMKIASLYYGEGGFYSAHERSDKFFWRELERLLREDGALCTDGLDGYSLHRVKEPYSQMGAISREKGWFAGISISSDHQRSIDRTAETDARQTFYNDTLNSVNDSYINSRNDFWNDQFAVGLEAEYHRPMGMRWQFDCAGHILFPVDDLDHGLDLELSAEAYYLIADRWTLSAYANQSRLIAESNGSAGKTNTDSWWISYGTQLSFFVEDHMDIGLNAEESQRVNGQSTWYLARNNKEYYQNFRISLYLTYRFMGAFDIPGLINPVRMLPFPK